MCAVLTLGLWNAAQLRRITIDNVDFNDKVEAFKNAALKILGESNDIDLTYCGVIMDNENTLSSYGVCPGEIVYGTAKKPAPPVVPPKTYTETDIQNVVFIFSSFNISGRRTALQKLTRAEVLEEIIAHVPGLADDPIAVSIIQDPELIGHMSNPETVRKMAETHPLLIEAANYIASHIEEDHTTGSPQASTSTGYSYSLEALSDEDDDLDSDTNVGSSGLTRNSSFNAITAAQLAAAIANATNTAFNTNSAGVPTTSSNQNSVITSEMFSSAIEQALGAPSGNEAPAENPAQRLEPQLRQMHEMGLVNDTLNVRALQITGGDVQAAIELVFNGAVE
ncbi:ubiquitin-like protein 7 [Aethina tumida]|uniref:ubiquitin-like protein 7 n=1 Tax=Aethina tumida TaxID=116153 RepID=UPI00096B1E6F|nr:ubiquitin-like protein 7 [Aethina tumida]